VTDEAQWDAYAELAAIDYADFMAQQSREVAAGLLEEFHVSKRLKTPPVRNWMAYVDDRAVAFFSSWEGANEIGVVEDLFTHPDYRHRGLATALLLRCIEDARSHGAGPILIAANPDDTPKQMYAAMGFVPRFIVTEYRKPPRES